METPVLADTCGTGVLLFQSWAAAVRSPRRLRIATIHKASRLLSEFRTNVVLKF